MPDDALTLREAIAVVDGTLGRSLTAGEQAQVSGTLGSQDAIQFDLPAGPQTITLALGPLTITRGVAITGPGASNLAVDGNGLDRVFVVGQIFTQDLRLNVSISGLTVTGGSAAFGGGLANFGTLTLTDCVLSNNAATANGGGGVYNVGALTLTGCTFSGNTTGGSGPTAGGGLQNISPGTVTANNCTFAGNTATGSGPAASSGAGAANSGAMSISGCTFSGNSAASDGGAVYSDGALTVSTTTFSNNSAGSDGGAIRSGGSSLSITASTFTGNTAVSVGGALDTTDATATLSNCTLVANTAGSLGGAVEAEALGGAVTLTNVTVTANRVTAGSSGRFGGGLSADRPITLDNTLVAGNVQGPAGTTPNDVGGTLDPASAYNLIGTGGAGGLTDGTNHNQVGVADPGLGSLADNGGPTQTVLPLPGSPAVAAGSTAFVTAGETDQRGLPRVVNGAVDIGAVELQIPETVQFDNADVSVKESDGVVRLTVNRVGGTGGTVEVPFQVTDGSAHAGTDYQVVTDSPLVFGPGVAQATITITINSDTPTGGDESFTVSLGTPFSPDGSALVSAGTPAQATVTILEPAQETFQLGPSVAVNQGDGVVVLTVTRSGATTGTVDVPFQVTDGSAHAGSDYQVVTTGPLVFGPGVAQATITVNLLPNGQTQEDRWFAVSLGTPTSPDNSAFPTLGATTQQAVKILEPEAFQVSGPAVIGENGGSATFTVTRTGSTDGDATVRYGIGGSALPGVDFTPPPGTLTIPAGQAQGTITIPILDSGQVDGNESLTLTLTGVTLQGATNAAAVGSQSAAKLTILETNPASGGITARLVVGKVGKKARLLVEVFSADTEALGRKFLSPFQGPRYRKIRVSVRDSNGDGVPDQVVLTATKGKRTVTVFLAG
jgi:predicted outer membrane repeat protein